MKALVELVARSLVDHPDDVVVEVVDGPQTATIEVRVAADDVGKLIGRGGRIIKAIRTLARAAATGSGKRVNVEVLRP
ncbi:MAG TPA: KH domain-containing protein [bacterium]|nr:KH domain-containing protein [bacterium]